MAPQSGAGAAVSSTTSSISATPIRKPAEKKYKCQFCSRAFSRSEHRSRHERSRKLYEPLTSTPPPWGTAHHELYVAVNADRCQQIPRKDLLSVLNVAVPLFDATSSFAMTALSMPKTVAPLYRQKAGSDRVPRHRRSKTNPKTISMDQKMAI